MSSPVGSAGVDAVAGFAAPIEGTPYLSGIPKSGCSALTRRARWTAPDAITHSHLLSALTLSGRLSLRQRSGDEDPTGAGEGSRSIAE